MNRWRSLFAVFPHGEALLTGKAAQWFLYARVLIVMMALAEASAWAYFGTYLGGQDLLSKTSFAVVLFVMVFVSIWIIDGLLINMDTATIAEPAEPSEPTRAGQMKQGVGMGLRALALGLSTLAAAPFLTRLAFSDSIDRRMGTLEGERLSTARSELAKATKKADADCEKIRDQQVARASDLMDKYRKETSGVLPKSEGGSLISGRRPGQIARSFQSQAVVQTGLAEIQQAKCQTLADSGRERMELFDGLLEQYRNAQTTGDLDKAKEHRAALMREFEVDLPEDSFAGQREVLEALEADPSFVAAQRAVQGFLWFLFGTLLLMKVYQPRSVSVYLSESLHDAWMRFHRGEFDHWILSGSKDRDMTPLRFEELMRHVYPTIRDADISGKRTRDELDSIPRRVDELVASREGWVEGMANFAASVVSEQEVWTEVMDKLSTTPNAPEVSAVRERYQKYVSGVYDRHVNLLVALETKRLGLEFRKIELVSGRLEAAARVEDALQAFYEHYTEDGGAEDGSATVAESVNDVGDQRKADSVVRPGLAANTGVAE